MYSLIQNVHKTPWVLLDNTYLSVVHKQSTTCKQLAMKKTLALLLFLFGMHSVACFHMKGGPLVGPACLKLCTSAM